MKLKSCGELKLLDVFLKTIFRRRFHNETIVFQKKIKTCPPPLRKLAFSP